VGRVIGQTNLVFKAINTIRRRRIYRRFLDSLVSYYGSLPFEHWRDLLSEHPDMPINFVYPLCDMFPRAHKDDVCSARIMPSWDGTSTHKIRITITLDEIPASTEMHHQAQATISSSGPFRRVR